MFEDDGRTEPAFQPEIGRTVNQYRILAKIGAGGMGEVYLAEDTGLDRSVALKFLPLSLAVDETLRARFTREAKAVASLHHPNIVHVYEVGEHQRRPFIAMEHVDGPSLRALLKEGPLDLDRALAFGEALAGAVEEAHRAGVVHRDIKPGNIVVDSSDRPKLLDFGLAVLPRDEALTKTGTTLGTVGYMAPEQVRGESVDQRSDLFSIGVLLYEMITGQQPFHAETEVTTLDRVLHRAPDPMARFRSEVPAGLEQIVAKLLEKDPGLRYQTAADLAADLKRERKTREGTLHTASMSIPVRKAKRPGWLVPAITVGALAVAAAVFEPWDRIPAPIVPEADASQSRIVVLDFQNLVGGTEGENLGAIVSSLLVTDLSESHYLQVVSRQRIFDVAKSLGHSSSEAIDQSLSEAIARKVGSRYMLTGTILQTEPNIVVTSQLSDVEAGAVTASQRVTGEPGEDVFVVVDKLTRELKQDLSLPSAAADEDDPEVAEITTSSPEAYRHFVAGRDYFERFFKVEAEREWKRAIEIDSTFASAYKMLSVLKASESEFDEADEYLEQAVRYIDRTNWRERLQIQSLQLEARGEKDSAITKMLEITDRVPHDPDAWHVLSMTAGRQHPNFINWVKRAIEADSAFAVAWNQLAYAYLSQDRYEEANHAVRRYVELVPNDPNPYDSQGDIFAWQGMFEEARAAYQKAYEIKPDFLYMSRYKLGMANLMLDDDGEALRIFRELADGNEPLERSMGRRGIVETHLYRGRYTDARRLLEAGIADADAAGRYNVSLLRYQYLAFMLSVLEQHDDALDSIDRALALFDEHRPEGYVWLYEAATWLACRAGREDLAESYIGRLESYEGEFDEWESMIQGSRAFLAIRQGDTQTAVRLTRPDLDDWKDFYTFYYHGNALLHDGRYEEAADYLERASNFLSQERLMAFPWNVLVYYELGLARESVGETERAIEAYAKFLDIWRDTEYRTPEMRDAEKRLAELRSGS